MALNKAIKAENGVTLSYHRIALVNIQVNQQITILVESYVDEAGRQIEKDYAKGLLESEPVFPYTAGEYISIPYDERMDMFKGNVVQEAYDWLKKQEKFINAEDVLENG